MNDFSYADPFAESESEDDVVLEPKPKRRKLGNRCWVKIEEFENAEVAQKAVNPVWKKSSSKNTKDGLRVEYRCSKGAYRRLECPAGLYLLYHADSSAVTMYQTDCDHENHDTAPNRGLAAHMKTFIREKFNEGITKPNALLMLIRKKQMAEPQKSKIVSYLTSLR